MKLKLLCSAGLLALMAACSHQGSVGTQGASAQALQGFAAMRAGDVSGAEAAYRAALAVNGNDPYALLGLAMARESQGDLAGAARNYEAAQLAGQGEISTMRLVSAGVVDSDAQVGLSEYAAQGLSRIYSAPRYAEAVYGTASTYEYASGTTTYQSAVPAVSTTTYSAPVTSYDQGVVYSDTTHSAPIYQGAAPQGSVTYAEPTYVPAQPLTYSDSSTSYAQPVYSGGETLTYAEPTYAQPTYAQPTYAEPTYAEPTYVPASEPVAYADPIPAPASYSEPVYAAPANSAASYGEIVYADPMPAPAMVDSSYTETAIAYAPAAPAATDYVASSSYESVTTSPVPASYTETVGSYAAVGDTGTVSGGSYAITDTVSYDTGTVIDGGSSATYAAPATEEVAVAYGDPQPVIGGNSGLLGPADYGITFQTSPGLPGGQYAVVDSGVGGAGAYSAQTGTEIRSYQAPSGVVQTAPSVDDSGLDLIFLGN